MKKKNKDSLSGVLARSVSSSDRVKNIIGFKSGRLKFYWSVFLLVQRWDSTRAIL